jgi:aldose 1-epimerase
MSRGHPDVLSLANDRLSLTLLPEVGGGVARFDWRGSEGTVALMRPCDHVPLSATGEFEPNGLACYPLVPWSNRITAGGFEHAGARVDLARNRADDDYPIHGTGWQRAWDVERHDAQEAALVLHDIVEGAYDYRARLVYRLDGDTLSVHLAVTNHGQAPLPFGLGLHPFFSLHGSVHLHAPAGAVWRNDERNLIPLARDTVPPAWDFSSGKALPTGGLNNAFQGWSGVAQITWPQAGLRMDIAADVDTYVLYVPEGETFFCFEPVDHPVNAVHLPGGPVAHGMTVLAPGDVLARSFAFRVSEEGQAC